LAPSSPTSGGRSVGIVCSPTKATELVVILEVVFCEGDQHCLQFCLDHFSCVKMAASQYYIQSRKQRKVGWVVDDIHIVFGQKFLVKKEV
jgi:hypothetical protein